MTDTHNHSIVASAGTSGLAALYWLVESVKTYGPGWGLVPPLLLSTASCVTAFSAFRRSQADERRADQIHALELLKLKRQLPPLNGSIETLPGRN